MKQTNVNKKAFTLVEIAVVLAIIGLIGALGFSASRDMIESARYAATQNKLDVIEKALNKYWLANGRLPCPIIGTIADNITNGVEAGTLSIFNTERCNFSLYATPANYFSQTNVNKAVEGVIPVLTLGLPKDFMFDGWGRKIVYAVTPQFAIMQAKDNILPQNSRCFSNTAIRVRDASGADRSTSAAYVLLSYGKNGHGGYRKPGGTTRYNAGSVNTDELTNCHCNSSAVNATYDGNYVQRSQNLNDRTPANYFDDIVRYKEGWQLVSETDKPDNSTYLGPDLAVGYIHATNGTVYTYKNQCAAFIKQSNLNPLPTNQVRGVAYTAGNKHLLVYSALGCNLYKINNNGTLTNLPNAFSTACPYNATAVMELSNNGYLAVSGGTSSATIKLWKQAGDQFVSLPDLTHSAASVSGLSFSNNADLLAVRSAGSTSGIYRRVGDMFSLNSLLITQPSIPSDPRNVVLSPDGKSLIVTKFEHNVVGKTTVIRYRIFYNNPISFLEIQNGEPFLFEISPSRYNTVTISDDSRYVIYGKRSTFTTFRYGLTSSAFHREDNTDIAISGSNDSEIAISKNSRFILYFNADLPRLALFSYSYLLSMNQYTDLLADFHFTTAGITGSSPVRAIDYIVTGSTSGPVAFAK